MKLSIFSAALLLAVVDIAAAAPTQPEARQAGVIVLEGAGPNPPSYTINPSFTSAENFTIDNPLSVSHIIVNTNEGTCDFFGSEGSNTFIVGQGATDVGPPQPQIAVKCCAFFCSGFPQYCCGGNPNA